MEKGIRQFLLEHAALEPISFHMPGHKGSRIYRENGYGDFLIIAKRDSGRKLMQALYNFALSFEHQKVARNIHNLKPDDFNNK